MYLWLEHEVVVRQTLEPLQVGSDQLASLGDLVGVSIPLQVLTFVGGHVFVQYALKWISFTLD